MLDGNKESGLYPDQNLKCQTTFFGSFSIFQYDIYHNTNITSKLKFPLILTSLQSLPCVT